MRCSALDARCSTLCTRQDARQTTRGANFHAGRATRRSTETLPVRVKLDRRTEPRCNATIYVSDGAQSGALRDLVSHIHRVAGRELEDFAELSLWSVAQFSHAHTSDRRKRPRPHKSWRPPDSNGGRSRCRSRHRSSRNQTGDSRTRPLLL